MHTDNQKTARDDKTTVLNLRNVVREFVEQRNWRQFHSPKNLSMALAIEAAELMEHFQWITPEESRTIQAQQRVQVGEELADVICYALAIANEMNIDITSTFYRKMDLNRNKYPVDQYKGRFGVDDPNPVSP